MGPETPAAAMDSQSVAPVPRICHGPAAAGAGTPRAIEIAFDTEVFAQMDLSRARPWQAYIADAQSSKWSCIPCPSCMLCCGSSVQLHGQNRCAIWWKKIGTTGFRRHGRSARQVLRCGGGHPRRGLCACSQNISMSPVRSTQQAILPATTLCVGTPTPSSRPGSS